LPNVPQFNVAYFAAHYLGAPAVPLNVLLTPDEIAHHITDSDAVAPLFHSFGQTLLQNSVLQAGGTVFMMPRFDPGTALGLIQKHRVNLFGGPHNVLRPPAPFEDGNDDSRKLSAGAVLADNPRELLEEALPLGSGGCRPVPRVGAGLRQADGKTEGGRAGALPRLGRSSSFAVTPRGRRRDPFACMVAGSIFGGYH
jgi:acyl-CoA synthetase (AMP-forming)/AMP-acid ligase II